MKTKRFLIVACALFLGLASCKRSTSLHYFDAYVGKDPAASGAWDSEPLHHQMKELMGNQYDQFMNYMKGAGPFVKGQYVYTYGRIAQDSTRGYAFILVDTKKDKMLTAIITNYQIQKFQDPAEAFTVPVELQDKIDSISK